MTLKTIAIVSPGDMGHAVGRSLGEHGYDVIGCLRGRSERTRALAKKGNVREIATLEEMVLQADLVMSILVPAEAVDAARKVADAIRATGSPIAYVDCNAVSPRTTATIDGIITGAGGAYIDGGIIGGPPGRGPAPRFYLSGPHAHVMAELDGKGIAIRDIGGPVGRASGIKMCYAALSKGTSTLHVAVLTAAEALGLSQELEAELRSSRPGVVDQMGAIPRLPANAHRWIGEMEEIAATFDAVGVTPHFHLGAAEMYRLLSRTPFAQEAPEEMDQSRTIDETIQAVARNLSSRVEDATETGGDRS